MNAASAPRRRSSAASCSPASSWRPATTSRAPSFAKAMAVARPMPVSAPVIKTTGLLMDPVLHAMTAALMATAGDFSSAQHETAVTGVGGFLALLQVQRQPAGVDQHLALFAWDVGAHVHGLRARE